MPRPQRSKRPQASPLGRDPHEARTDPDAGERTEQQGAEQRPVDAEADARPEVVVLLLELGRELLAQGHEVGPDRAMPSSSLTSGNARRVGIWFVATRSAAAAISARARRSRM